ncbi:MAG: M42 family metallopeptidase [Clostridiales bacterium]|nr:M42 family metallopeptidase [Clostridiales bacterium]
MLETLKALCSLEGISGNEGKVREYIISRIDGKAEYSVDPLGNLIVFKKGKKASKNKVMLDAHTDEVGLIITCVTDDGLLKFDTVGGINPSVLLGRAVRVGSGEAGGVIGVKPVHLLKESEENTLPEISDMYIDIGAADKADALRHVSAGDIAFFDSELIEFGDSKIKARALDDRVGCAVMIKLIESDLEYDAWFSFSSQEEVGTRGATAAAFTIAPDYAIVLETTTAADIIDVPAESRVCLLGNGPAVSFMDRSTVYDKELFNTAFRVAAENGIKCQPKTMVAGGNDAGAIHKSRGGVKTVTLSTPCRYLHSPSCVIDFNDAEDTLRLAGALLTELCNA